MADYLHAKYVQDDTGLFEVSDTAGDPIGDGLSLNLSGGDGANNQGSKDEVDPIAPAQTMLTYRAGTAAMLAEPVRPTAVHDATAGRKRGVSSPEGVAAVDTADKASKAWAAGPAANISTGTAGLRVDTGTYKVVYFSFGFVSSQ